MKTHLVLFFVVLTTAAFSQGSIGSKLTIKKQSKREIIFTLKNTSIDTLHIEDFNCVLKKNKYVVVGYTTSNDTLILNWNNRNETIQTSHPTNYYIDGTKTKRIFKISPNDEYLIGIRLCNDDFKKVENITIYLNSTDTISVRL